MEGAHEMKAYKWLFVMQGQWVPSEIARQEVEYKSSTFSLWCIIKPCHRTKHRDDLKRD